MRDIDAQVQALSSDDLTTHLAGLKARFEDHDGLGLDASGIEALFEWMLGSAHVGALQTAVEVFHLLDVAIGDFLARHPGSEEGVDFRFEWSMAAIRFVSETRDEFVCLPIYEDLFAFLAEAPASRQHLAVRARLHLMKRYQFWLEKGGKVARLDPQVLAWIGEMEQGYEEASDDALSAAEERGDIEVVVQLFRDAAQYYFLKQQPNDGIACLKSALEEMPHVDGYIPADSAHVMVEIGQVFLSFKKPAIALKYFNQAKDIYDEGGEEMEMDAFRAEGWIDACKKLGA
jgi:tetratricopeptide (TPR) repeat protein